MAGKLYFSSNGSISGSWFALLSFFILFGLAAFGMAIYSVVAINTLPPIPPSAEARLAMINQELIALQIATSPNTTVLGTGACLVFSDAVSAKSGILQFTLNSYQVGNGISQYYVSFTTPAPVVLNPVPASFTPHVQCPAPYNFKAVIQIYDCTGDVNGLVYSNTMLNNFADNAYPRVPFLPGQIQSTLNFGGAQIATSYYLYSDSASCVTNSYQVSPQSFTSAISGFPSSTSGYGLQFSVLMVGTQSTFTLVRPLVIPLGTFVPSKK